MIDQCVQLTSMLIGGMQCATDRVSHMEKLAAMLSLMLVSSCWSCFSLSFTSLQKSLQGVTVVGCLWRCLSQSWPDVEDPETSTLGRGCQRSLSSDAWPASIEEDTPPWAKLCHHKGRYHVGVNSQVTPEADSLRWNYPDAIQECILTV